MVKVFIGVLVSVVVLIVVFQFVDPNFGNVVGNIVSENTASLTSLSVSISGEITRAGTYVLDPNSTLEMLIELASGVTSNADELAYDTSYVLQDGLSFYIAPKYDMNDVCEYEPIAKVNINEASEDELMEINGVGNAIATSIISYRDENGQFGRIEDIKNVSGIGNATFEKIKNYIVLRSS